MLLLYCHTTIFSAIATIIGLAIALGGSIIGLVQLSNLQKSKCIDFTYKVYIDLFNWLNDPKNTDIKEWLLEKDNYKSIPIEQYFRLGDLFEKFEAVNVLQKRSSLDEETFYALISFYVDMAAHLEKRPTAREFIKTERLKHEKKIPVTSNVFAGFYKLRVRIHKYEIRKHYKELSRPPIKLNRIVVVFRFLRLSRHKK